MWSAVIPAVLAGNSVVLKMSPRTPLTAGSAFEKAFQDAGAPANLVTSLDCANDVAASVSDLCASLQHASLFDLCVFR